MGIVAAEPERDLGCLPTMNEVKCDNIGQEEKHSYHSQRAAVRIILTPVTLCPFFEEGHSL